MSFGNQWTEIVLDQHDTTLVLGKNGSGKSSAILDAISFALFNKPFRNINKPQLANSITGKQCLVELEFTANGHDIVVRRGIKPDLFEIYKDDELITESADRRDYQQAFEKYILKVNHKTFCQVVMLGSAIFVPFMSLPAQDRRNVIEDLLDLKVFSKMNAILAQKIKDLDRDIERKESEKALLEEKIQLTESHIKELKQSNEALIAEKETIIKELLENKQIYIDRIAGINENILWLSSQINGVETLSSKVQGLTKIQHQLQHKISQIDKEVSFLQDNTVCPTCAQQIDEEFKIEAISSKAKNKDEVTDGLTKLQCKLKESQEKLNQITSIQAEIHENAKDIEHTQSLINYNDKTLRSIKAEIEKLKQKKEEIDTSSLEAWKAGFETISSKITEMNEDRRTMGYASTLLKDSGIKAKIIKTYIPVINQLIQKYLAILDFFVEFTIDEQFKEKIKSRYRDEFSYASFSEGEKARLNLAIMFTWRALAKLRGSIDCNLVIFDEVLDGSLDNEGVENTTKLLSQLTNGQNIIIISHKEGAYEEKVSRVLRFEKHKNFSQLVSS